MAYQITYTQDANLDLRSLPKAHEAFIRRAAPRYLAHEPARPSNKRREMEPNPLGAQWELRLDDLRVYYDVDGVAQVVRVLRVGRKRRERVFVRGVETDLRESEEQP